MRPPPLSPGATSLKHCQNGDLKRKSENFIFLKEKKKKSLSWISCFSDIPCADGPILTATETWGAGRKASEKGRGDLKNSYIKTDLKLLQELGYQIGKASPE